MTTIEDYLPNFNSVSSVSARNAMIDRFELEMGDFPLAGDEDDILFVLNHLAAYRIPTSTNREANLFNASNNRSLSNKIEVEFSRRGSGGGFFQPSPIISGVLRKARRRSGHRPRVQGESTSLSFQTSLNLA